MLLNLQLGPKIKLRTFLSPPVTLKHYLGSCSLTLHNPSSSWMFSLQSLKRTSQLMQIGLECPGDLLRDICSAFSSRPGCGPDMKSPEGFTSRMLKTACDPLDPDSMGASAQYPLKEPRRPQPSFRLSVGEFENGVLGYPRLVRRVFFMGSWAY